MKRRSVGRAGERLPGARTPWSAAGRGGGVRLAQIDLAQHLRTARPIVECRSRRMLGASQIDCASAALRPNAVRSAAAEERHRSGESARGSPIGRGGVGGRCGAAGAALAVSRSLSLGDGLPLQALPCSVGAADCGGGGCVRRRFGGADSASKYSLRLHARRWARL